MLEANSHYLKQYFQKKNKSSLEYFELSSTSFSFFFYYYQLKTKAAVKDQRLLSHTRLIFFKGRKLSIDITLEKKNQSTI